MYFKDDDFEVYDDLPSVWYLCDTMALYVVFSLNFYFNFQVHVNLVALVFKITQYNFWHL